MLPSHRSTSRPVPFRFAGLLLVALAALLFSFFSAAGARTAQALVQGQFDDFETETAEGWQIGLGNVAVQTTGGPEGVGDAYLEPTATGGLGAGSRLVVFNGMQWAGDYTTEQVGTIAVDAIHIAGSDVFLRIALSGPTGSVVSTLPIVLSPPAIWEPLEFSLDPADLTFLGGTGDTDTVLAGATQLRFLHSVAIPPLGAGGLPSGDAVVATIGLDNIEAVPEPGAVAQLVAGAVALAWLGRRRARAR